MLTAIFGILLGSPELKSEHFFKELGSATPAQVDELLGEPEYIEYLAIAPPTGFSINKLATTLEKDNWPLDFPGYQVRHTKWPGIEYKKVTIESTTWHGNKLVAVNLRLPTEVDDVGDIPAEDLQRMDLPLPTSPPIFGYDPPRIGGSNTTIFYRFSFDDPQDAGNAWHALYHLNYDTAFDSHIEGEPMGVSLRICLSRLDWMCDLAAPGFGDQGPYKFIPRLIRATLNSNYTFPLSRPLRIGVDLDKGTTFEQAAGFVKLDPRDYAVMRQERNFVFAKPVIAPLSSVRFQQSYFWGPNDELVETVLAYQYRWGIEDGHTIRFSLETTQED